VRFAVPPGHEELRRLRGGSRRWSAGVISGTARGEHIISAFTRVFDALLARSRASSTHFACNAFESGSIFALNQSLDGYVDHLEFAPGPSLFVTSASKCAT
jgi:hypothetical protein